MYHPDSMLRIAHEREGELIRDAQLCDMPKSNGATDWATLAPILVALTILATALLLIA